MGITAVVTVYAVKGGKGCVETKEETNTCERHTPAEIVGHTGNRGVKEREE